MKNDEKNVPGQPNAGIHSNETAEPREGAQASQSQETDQRDRAIPEFPPDIDRSAEDNLLVKPSTSGSEVKIFDKFAIYNIYNILIGEGYSGYIS